MECLRREGYHLDEYNFLFEIVDPDPEGYGELVVTTLSRRTMPLVRYRVRDVTRFINEPCPCGATLRRMAKIQGRRGRDGGDGRREHVPGNLRARAP